MNDGVHPTKAGYLLWWTPAIQRQLYHMFLKETEAPAGES